MFPTTPLRLYRMPISGHCHRVELMLSLLGLPYELIDVNLLRGEHQRAEFLALNPLGQVPVLVDAGQVLSDSNGILVYLVQRYAPGSAWLPQDAVGQAQLQRWFSLAAGFLAPGIGGPRFATLTGRAVNEVAQATGKRLLAFMEDELQGRAWLLGGSAPSLADVAMVSYTSQAHLAGLPLDAYPRIAAWVARMQALPGYPVLVNTPIETGIAREVAVARELTKLHEECRSGSAADLADHYAAHPPKGEIVLLIGPPAEEEAPVLDADALLRAALADAGPGKAAGIVAKATGIDRAVATAALAAATSGSSKMSISTCVTLSTNAGKPIRVWPPRWISISSGSSPKVQSVKGVLADAGGGWVLAATAAPGARAGAALTAWTTLPASGWASPPCTTSLALSAASAWKAPRASEPSSALSAGRLRPMPNWRPCSSTTR